MTRKELYQTYRKRFPEIPMEARLAMMDQGDLTVNLTKRDMLRYVPKTLIPQMKKLIKETDNGS